MRKKIDPEKKKQYNEKYRAKKKLDSYDDTDKPIEECEKEETLEEPQLEIEKCYESLEDPIEHKEETPENGDVIVIEKEVYEELMRAYMEKQESTNEKQESTSETPEPKRVEETRETDSFFFQVKKSLKNQVITLAATAIPIVLVQGIAVGAKYLMSTNEQKYTGQQQTQSKEQHPQYQPVQMSLSV
jgi:hypothetical protein